MISRLQLAISAIIIVSMILSIWMCARTGKIAHNGGENMGKTEAVWYCIMFALTSFALMAALVMLWIMKHRPRF